MKLRRNETRPSANRARVMKLAVVLTGVVGAAVGGYGIGSRVQSPAEAASRRAAPEASRITVPVERKALENSLVRRGSVRFADAKGLSLAGSVGGDTAAQSVTKVRVAGEQLEEGGLLLEVNGRPVFALSGAQPMYRALRPGTTGADVEQLEAALARLGYDPGPVDTMFDVGTQMALAKFYEDRGYAAQGPTAAENDALRAARKAAADAEERVKQAQISVSEAGKPAAASEVLGLQNEVKRATQALETAKLNRTRNDNAAKAAVTTRTTELDSANAAATAAANTLEAARQSGLDPRDGTTPCDTTCISRLTSEAASARSAAAAAVVALDTAKADIQIVANTGANEVSAAEDALTVANTRLTESNAPKDTRSASQALESARDAATEAAAEVRRLEGITGISVPAGELVFVPTLPARIDGVKATVGTAPGADFVTISGDRLNLDSSVESADVDQISVGMKVTLEVPGVEKTYEGTIAEIAQKAGTNGVASTQVYVRITLDDAAAGAELNGAGVVVTIPIRSTEGEVLVVPVAALTTRADRTNWLTVSTESGATREQQVTVGLQANGLVEVSATGGGSLVEGDRVAVGTSGQPGTDDAATDDGATDDEAASDG